MRIQDDFKNLCDWVAIKKKKKKNIQQTTRG